MSGGSKTDLTEICYWEMCCQTSLGVNISLHIIVSIAILLFIMNNSKPDNTGDLMFWIRCAEKLISFSLPQLPKDVHFSISYEDRSPDINFHVTRNTSEDKNKPKIEVLRIDKQLFQALIPYITDSMLNQIFIPVKFKSWEKKSNYHYDEIFYIPLNSFSPRENSLVEATFKDYLSDKIRIKNKTLKLSGDIEAALQKLVHHPVLKGLIKRNNWRRLPRHFQENPSLIYISSRKFSGIGFYFNGQLYSFREGVSLEELLSPNMVAGLVKTITFKTYMAIARVSKANSYDDTRPFNNSMRLIEINNHGSLDRMALDFC